MLLGLSVKGMTFEVLCGTIHRTGGPRSSGTQADGDNTLAEPRQPRTSQAYKMLIIDVGEPTPELVVGTSQ